MNEKQPQPPANVALTFNPRLSGAQALAKELCDLIQARGVRAWLVEDEEGPEAFEGSDLVVCLGGDGSVLRCARQLMQSDALILGVNLGRLGFLTEMDASQVRENLGRILAGEGRIEERSMLRALVPRTGQTFHGLNEAVIGRATLSRAIHLAVDVDGTRIADYRCDGVIVASATGSTAYALSVGGPILPPESSLLVVVPVAPHLAAQHAVVLPGSESVRVTLEPGQMAVLSVDGEPDVQLHAGDSVIVSRSEYRARFLRLKPPGDFYARMAAQLGWHRPAGNAEPLPVAALEGGENI